jgi:hypothetical protein
MLNKTFISYRKKRYAQENIKSIRINATKSEGSQMPVYLIMRELKLDEIWAVLIVDFSFGHMQFFFFFYVFKSTVQEI